MKQAIWVSSVLFWVGCASTSVTRRPGAAGGISRPALDARLSPLMVGAAQALAKGGLRGARQVLAEAGFHPFVMAQVAANDERTMAAMGLTHCAAAGRRKALCARLTVRVIDRSPIHLQVQAMPGFELGRVHVVMPNGRVVRRRVDRAGIVDLPVLERSAAQLGVTTTGPAGPETGLLLTVGQGLPPAGTCARAVDPNHLVAALNGERQAIGLRPLAQVAAPSGYARMRSFGLNRRFGHPSGGLGNALRDLGLALDGAAEVVGEDASLTAVCRSWMRSPAHRYALMAPHRDRIALVRSGRRVAALLWRQR
jgi:hypothetical protein